MTNGFDGDGRATSGSQHRSDETRSAGAAAPSPQLARAVRATAEVWRRLEEEFGLLTSGEVAELLGVTPAGPSWVAAQRKARKIIGVRRGNTYRYPGFQFDHQTVLPVIAPLLELARANGWSSDDLTLWIFGPTTSFVQEDRPVDHLREPEAVLATATLTMEALW
ncbi:DNA-binding protein [Cryobacterium sp. TmT2-59]|uniref:helix-turn-helix domain-containing protein n=1 Tax=unclassified Cryobacterium TaxID=2649013 RepID=UPI00106CDD7B|nr:MULTISPECIES: helix-turn-helix domain-containing protein [unclassified Cryobacterium]TFC86916.1 DNA-binding protein [Cryobacterium sp. TmT2-59]TFD14625.1 DNA-binding protein [Cryobacterium sp. TMT4-10]